MTCCMKFERHHILAEHTQEMIAPVPTLLVDMPCETGEGPLWHEKGQFLTWLDIPAGRLYLYEPGSGINTLIYEHDGSIGGHTHQADGSMLLFSDDGTILHLKDGEVSTLVERIEAVVGSRFNDVIVDPEGRVFCGTMPLGEEGDGPAHLYRLNHDGSLHLVWDDLTLSNGMGFSPDLSTFYLSDSDGKRIFRADYDRQTGNVSNREVLIQLDTSEDAVCDGMTLDANGMLWVALWDGQGLQAFTPDGNPHAFVPFPVRKVSSITFGGANHDVAYVTTAGGSERGEHEGKLAGSLFSVDLQTSGRPEFISRIQVP